MAKDDRDKKEGDNGASGCVAGTSNVIQPTSVIQPTPEASCALGPHIVAKGELDEDAGTKR